MKKKIMFLCVNYNSYNELENFLQSIKISQECFQRDILIDVFIGDNTVKDPQKINISKYSSLNVTVIDFNKNLGYMGAVMSIINRLGKKRIIEYDYTIVSNVDLLLSESFFQSLVNIKIKESIGWIAPQIFSLSEMRDRNPKILYRPSLKKIQLLLVMYKYPVLYRLYTNLIYKHRRKKLKNPAHNKIYAGHGSFMIFTRHFMEHHVNFRFPSFLFGEEIFFGELARSSNLDVLYIPDIVVKDIDHASTSKLKRKTYCRMNFESLSKIKSLYY